MNFVKDDYYPTPAALADKMCECLSGREELILEPSAGKGNIIEAIMRRMRGRSRNFSIDMLEKDDELRDILSARYSEGKKRKTREEIRSLEEKARVWDAVERKYESILTMQEEERLKELRERRDLLSNTSFFMAGEDFLSYNTWKKYDAIIMNPPFSEGAKHLLKAISLMRYGGKIVCLLNKETLENPYTNERKMLLEKLTELNADVSYVTEAFSGSDSERKTEVEIALVSLSIPEAASYDSQILSGLNKAREEKEKEAECATEVSTKTTWIDALIEQCGYELEAGYRLYSEYKQVLPYMCRDYDKKDYSGNIIELMCNGHSFEPNEFAKAVRAKYWRKFFSNEQFNAALTSNLTTTFDKLLCDASEYEFTKNNVLKMLKNIAEVLGTARDETILELFDKLSQAHSWCPECAKNIHYYNGWAANKAHKVSDKKVILPINGFSAYSGKLDTFRISNEISDIEKVFNYLASGSDVEFIPIDVYGQLRYCENASLTSNIDLKYFTVTFYKKGTCHITFREEAKPLIEKLNIIGSQKKGWLPPCYGKKTYQEMTEEERKVVDEFQGRESYEKVLHKKDFFLSENTFSPFAICC